MDTVPTDPLSKARPTSTDFMEIGSSGLHQFGGEIQQDFLRQLRGKQAYANYREMADNDPVVGAMLHAIEMLIRAVDWSVEPADDDDERAVAEAEFVSSCLTDMSTSWADTLAAILGFLVYGYSYHEIVYKRRQGFTKDPLTRSKFSDGRIGWRKLPTRSQETIDRWELDPNGGIRGAYQMDPNSPKKGVTFLPIEKCLLFRTTSKLNNPQGRSILRNAFIPWYYKRRIQEIEAIGIERDLAGLPVALVPPQLLSNAATAEERAALDAIKQIVRNVKRDEQEGIVFPLAYDPETGNPAYDLKLLSTGGRRQFDTDAIIGRYDQRIAMTVLADFLLLGHEAVGTQALSVSKVDLFVRSLDAFLSEIAEVFNNHAIPRLMRLNGVDEGLSPTLTWSTPKSVDLGAIGSFVTSLAQAGAPLFPDENLEGYLRSIAGLPVGEAEAV
ncbi:MAG: phage portal protein family protein [Ilumatobacteraceae bacterium]